MNAEYKVLLPKWIWEKATDKKEASNLIKDYMKHYPHYQVIAVKDGFAICYRK